MSQLQKKEEFENSIVFSRLQDLQSFLEISDKNQHLNISNIINILILDTEKWIDSFLNKKSSLSEVEDAISSFYEYAYEIMKTENLI